MNMNDATVGFKLEPDRRGFEPEKIRAVLAEPCVPLKERAVIVVAHRRTGRGAGQARSRQVKAGQA